MSDPILTARGLTKRYSHRTAIADLDLTVGRGETWAVFGRNGAGKSTLIRLLSGLSVPTDGLVRIAGADPRLPGVRRRIGVVGHSTYLLGDLTAEENLLCWCNLYGLDRPKDRVGDWLDRVGLEDYRRERTSVLSRGQAQRLTLARALVPEPEILLLDEPFTGLDLPGAALLREEIGKGGRTTIFATHDVEAGLALADHVLALKAGRDVHSGESGTIGPREVAERL
ncbi:MAG: ABC transporter ATP-binding protein [Planctomycetota bacterium]|nr:ABC transporter ATP-binding protein [Planctomycetota bacterium]